MWSKSGCFILCGAAAFFLSMLMHASAADIEPAFQKVPLTLQAANFLPQEALTGPNYRVEPTVMNDGLVNVYQLTTDYGPLTIESTAMVIMRIAELNALDSMAQVKQTSAFKDALVAGAKAPLMTAKGLITEPVDTVKGIGTGIGNWVSNIGHSIASDNPNQENVFSAAVGYAAARRDFAYEYGINPYTSYEPVQKELGELARANVVGGFTPKIAFSLAKRPVGTALRLSGTADTMKKLVRDNPPEKLEDINRKKLAEMGIADDQAQSFLKNPSFDPQETTLLVGALENMATVKGRDRFIQMATVANEPSVAMYMRLQAQMAADYHTNVAPVETVLLADGTPFLQRKDGTVVGLFPLDYLAWTPGLWHKEAAVSEFFSKNLAGVNGKEIWSMGSFDPVARKALESRGWSVQEKVESKLGWK